MAGERIQIATADILVIVGYFVSVVAVGIWSSFRNRGSVGGYFLAGRSMHAALVGASLFASNIGSGHFIGLAGAGAASGIGTSVFELNAIFVLMLLGWIFVPVYMSSGVYTMPEYLKKRFGGQRIRIYLAFLALILYIFTKISADLYAGAVFIEQALQWNIWISVIILLAIAALFTVTGGLTAVIWTDFIQTIIMVVGAAILTILSFVTLDQSVQDESLSVMDKMWQGYKRSISNTTIYSQARCGFPPPTYGNLFQPASDPNNFPWTGLFGLTISSVWYWCTDQVIVQRALAAKNLSHAKAGCIIAGYLKLLPMWLIVFPGMIARILFPDEIACTDPNICQKVCSADSCTNVAYPLLVIKVMPVGVRGVMLAVMMASLMSSLTSIFNSASTIFTMDIWRHFRRFATETELMIVGRVFVVVLVGVSIAWVPVVQKAPELFHYIQAVTSYLAPPICAVFVLGFFWSRINEIGAFCGLMAGLVVGLVRFGWEYSFTVPPCGEEYRDRRPWLIKDVHYLHFGLFLWVVSGIVTIVVSLCTEPISKEYIVRLTFWTRKSFAPRVDIDTGDIILDNSAVQVTASPKPQTVKSYESVSSSQPQQSEPPSVAASTTAIIAQPAEEKQGCWTKAILWLCGIEQVQKATVSDTPHLSVSGSDSIRERRRSRLIISGNAVFLGALAVFLAAFYF